MTSKRQNQNDISELRGGMIWGIIEKFLIFSLKTRFVYRIIPNIKLNMILYHLKPSSAVKFWSKKRLNSFFSFRQNGKVQNGFAKSVP